MVFGVGGARFVRPPKPSSFERIGWQNDSLPLLLGVQCAKVGRDALRVKLTDRGLGGQRTVLVALQARDQTFAALFPIGRGHASQNGLRSNLQQHFTTKFFGGNDAGRVLHGGANMVGPILSCQLRVGRHELARNVADQGKLWGLEGNGVCDFCKRF